MEAQKVDMFIMMNSMGLYNTHLGVLIPYIGQSVDGTITQTDR